jgi:PLP dependent protein
MIDAAQVAVRLHDARARLAAGGHPNVSVMAVTKTWPIDAVHAAIAAGCDAVGENYAQEMASKFGGVDLACPRVFIGRLQTNKVRLLVDVVDVVESVDRPTLVDELGRRLPGLEVLIQVSTNADPGKGGCAPDDVEALVSRAVTAGLRVQGLMTVGPTEGGVAAAVPGFRLVRRLVDRLGLAVCSMGMSDDFEVAADEGATEVRLGSALFGPRPRG